MIKLQRLYFTFICLFLAEAQHQRYKVFLLAEVTIFWTKNCKISPQNATIITNGNHSVREKVMNRVILFNEQQLFKNASYISKLEPFPQKFQKIQVKK